MDALALGKLYDDNLVQYCFRFIAMHLHNLLEDGIGQKDLHEVMLEAVKKCEHLCHQQNFIWECRDDR